MIGLTSSAPIQCCIGGNWGKLFVGGRLGTERKKMKWISCIENYIRISDLQYHNLVTSSKLLVYTSTTKLYNTIFGNLYTLALAAN